MTITLTPEQRFKLWHLFAVLTDTDVARLRRCRALMRKIEFSAEENKHLQFRDGAGTVSVIGLAKLANSEIQMDVEEGVEIKKVIEAAAKAPLDCDWIDPLLAQL
jgi:hypothetical protein